MYLFQDFKGIGIARIMWKLFIGGPVRAVFLYRLSSWFWQHKLRPLAMMIWSLNMALHACDISPEANIGPGFRLTHTVGLVIGAITAGKNLTAFQNVTVAAFKTVGRHIGDNVYLNTGCCVLAPVGDYVSIGANAVVVKEVPSHSTAVGVPARVIRKDADAQSSL